MYLHIGNNKNVREKRIIGIFDTESSTVSETTKKFLKEAEKRGEVESAGLEIPKSFVLYFDKNEEFKICFSQLLSSSLSGRLGKLDE